jgi:hypothetical protein
MKSANYEPKHLELWTMPANYAGEIWPRYFVFLWQNRDSDTLSRSNFAAALDAIGGESETVEVIRENHWAVGWVEWIGIHQDDAEALRKADGIAASLEDYPIVDEEHFSGLEEEEASEIWRNCYDREDRTEYIRENRSQFEFRSMADMVGSVRGEYFGGYASELCSR